MKIKYYISSLLVIIVLFAGLLNSCSDDYFNTETGGRITPDEHYKSLIDATSSLEGCFALLGNFAENQVLIDGLLSDQMDVTDNADADMVALNTHDLTSTNSYLDVSNYYKVIINVNEVLPHLDQIVKLDRDFDSLTYKQYKGSLITLRAWVYFNIAKLYGQVAWIDETQTDYDPSKQITYLTKSEVIDRLIDELLPFYDAQDLIRFRMDHYVLLGELYLEKNDYASAAQFLKFAIDGSYYNGGASRVTYMVTTKYQKLSWQNIFIDAEDQTLTVMSAVPYSLYNNHKNNLEDWMVFKEMVKPTNIIMNAFNNETNADIYRGKGVSFDDTGVIPHILKYSLDVSVPSSADVILYRDADVHLMLAEALNRSGKSDLALILLNKGMKNEKTKPDGYSIWTANIGVRNRVSLASQTVPTGVNTVEYVEDLIIQERAEELAFEGKRWFDLIRIASRRGDPAYLADKVAAKFSDQTTASAVKTKLMDPNNWYFPLPK